MGATRRHRMYAVLSFVVISLILISTAVLIFTSTGIHAQSEKTVREAWVLMNQLGKYQFSTTVEQVTYPAPALTNVGRSSTTEVVYLTGDTDLDGRTMHINLRQDTGSLIKSQEGIEIKIEQGKASGRVVGSPTWQPLDDFSTVSFAPGQDAASFLTAARSARLVATETLRLPTPSGDLTTLQVSRYSFLIDSNRFAEYMRDQLTAELQREGKLPPGLTLDLTDQYRGMDAAGEVWIDQDGLPIRMKVDMKLPALKSGERIEARISTDFLNHDRNKLYAARPLPWRMAGMLGMRLNQSDLARLAADIALLASLTALLVLTVIFSQKRVVYAIIAGLVILSMLVSPIWQAAKVSAFSSKAREQQAQASAQEAQREQAQMQEASLFGWDPQANPFEQARGMPVTVTNPQAFGQLTERSLLPQMTAGEENEADTDQDGLTDTFESTHKITVLNPNKADTDDDGLTDSQELKLNLLPGRSDSDRDIILDVNEVTSFYYAGKDWYTNPETSDTDMDGRVDGIECPERVISDSNPSAGVCTDTDNDGIPDVFDEDDDGDSVPTYLDESPMVYAQAQEIFSANDPFELSLNNIASDKPVYITYQLRPENPLHLTYSMNVLDWVTGDTDGQIQRVSQDTFATAMSNAQKAADPEAANGDLRLAPMVEIRLKGSDLPLPITNKLSFPLEDSDFTGTFELISIPGSGTQVNLTAGPNQANPIYYATGSCDEFRKVDKVGDLAQGGTGQISTALGDLVNGNHVLYVKGDADKTPIACVEVPIVAHGSMKNALVDSTMLSAYGASARNDTDESVLVYAPLNLMQDSSTGMPVAFSAQVPFLNRGGSFNRSEQEVRVVWLLNMLTDSCKPKPNDYEESKDKVWCNPKDLTHWNLNIPRIVHSYAETFLVAGLSVKEELGVEMAVVFEDPDKDPDPQYDDPLWALSRGLERSFMAGRATQNGENEQGNPLYQRDLPIDEIQHRFDPDFNADIPDNDDRLWSQPRDTFQVERYHYATADAVISFSNSGVKELFAEYYNSLPAERIPEEALLLFARETNERRLTLGEPAAACAEKQCVFDFSGLPQMTNAVMNWAPYRLTDGAWSSYPISEYLDHLEANLRLLDGFQPSESTQDARDAADGKVLLARLYFQSMFRGVASLVAFDGEPMFNPQDAMYDGSLAEDFSTDSGRGQILSEVPTNIAESIVDSLGDNPNLSAVGDNLKTLGAKVKDFFKDLKQTLSFDNIKTQFKSLKLKAVASMAFTTVIVAVIITSALITYLDKNGIAGKWAGRALDMAMALKAVVDGLQSFFGAAEDLAKLTQTGQSIFSGVSKASQVASVVGLILNIAITWGIFFASWAISGVAMFGLAFNDMLAQAIAATMTIILLAVIACTVVGTVIVALIGLFDAALALLCAAVGATELVPDPFASFANNYICIGISGWLNKIYKWFIYSQTYLIDYDSGERLEFTGLSQDFKDKYAGTTEGNMVSVQVDVENTITLSSVPFNWMAAAYFWQYNQENAKSATFNYKLQVEEKDIHGELERGTISKKWTEVEPGWKWKYKDNPITGTDADHYVIPVPELGLNHDPELYLSEGSAVPVQECFSFPLPIIGGIWIPVCYIRTEKATINSPLGSSLTMDVLPSTLDGFYNLAEAVNEKKEPTGGYYLSWANHSTLHFPVMRDADGDTLISKAFNGNDPDDSKYDTDGDKLSDYYEISHGLNPRLFDTDEDGMTDADEISLGTSPQRADTDGDGLTDRQELDGWLFVYGFTPEGEPLETMVYPDPFTQDSDADGITDLLEKVYGFNPRVKNQANVLDYQLSLRELDSPLVLLRFDEANGASMFSDASNFMFNAVCEETACPASGLDGRYAQAIRMDGENFVHLPSSARGTSFVDNQPFTLGAWVYRQGSGVVLAKWSDAPGAKQELRLEVTGSGSLSLVGSEGTITSLGTLPQETWAHAAVSFDGAQATFYINGQAAGCQGGCAWSNDPTFTPDSTDSEITVGAYAGSSGTTGFFTGMLDELAIFDFAMSGPAIQERLVTARYNFNDTFVRPGEEIAYRSKVTNLLNNRFVYGLLTTLIDRKDAIVDWAMKLLPVTFVLGPDNPIATQEKTNTITNTLQINPAVSESGDLKISQTVSAQVVDRRTESNLAELWLKFNEGSGATKFEDSSGSMPPRNITCTSCPDSGQEGILNQAVRFNAGSAPLVLPGMDTLRMLNRGYTLAMWVRPDATGANTAIELFKSENESMRLWLSRLPNGEYTPLLIVNGTLVPIEPWRNLLPGVWSHLVMRYDSQSQTLTLFVNGASVGEAGNIAPITQSEGLRLGGEAPVSYSLDDVRLFSRPLSTVDINRLAERPVLMLNMDGGFNDSSVYGQPVSTFRNAPAHIDGSIRGAAMTPGQGSTMGLLQVNGNSLLDMSDGTFTFSAWINPETSADTSSWQGVFGYHSGDNDAYPSLERRGRQLRFGFGNGTAFQSQASGDVLEEGRWNHVVVTFQPSPSVDGSYEYILYVNGVEQDSLLFTTKPAVATNSTFYVGHSSRKYSSTLTSLKVDDVNYDWGGTGEMYIYRTANGNERVDVWGSMASQKEVSGGQTYTIGVTSPEYSADEVIRYDVTEIDNSNWTNPDDDCGALEHYWWELPGQKSAPMTNGINGTLLANLSRPSTQFIGSIDELEVYRYALDSEQVFDLYNAIPITARLPLDDRPSSDTFENRAVIGLQDDGVCSNEVCPSAGTIGLINQAVRFDGTDDVINVPVSTTENYMVSLWLNTTCTDCGAYSLTSGAATLNQVYLKSGNLCALTGGSELCSRGGGVADGRWHHAVYTNDGTTANLWLDGAVASMFSGGAKLTPAPEGQALLGYAATAGKPVLDGQLDDVRVFRYSQAADVVAQLQRRAPLLLAHLDEASAENGFKDATPQDWTLGCAANGDEGSSQCPKTDMDGRLGRSIEFDGQNDRIALQQDSLSAITQSFSVGIWVMPTRLSSAPQTLWSMPFVSTTQGKYSVAIAADTMKLCVMNGSSTATCAPQSNVDLIMNTWNYVTLTVDRESTSRETYTLYINGYRDQSGEGNTGTLIGNGLGRLTLGNLPEGAEGQAGGAFAGKLDEPAVYEYVLGEIDVRDTFYYQMQQVEERASLSITIDADDPLVALSSYNPEFPYLSGQDTILQVDASDVTSGIGMVEMQVEHPNASQTRWVVAPVCRDSANGTSFCPTFIPSSGDGVYTLTFRAVDRVGHQTQTESYQINVDRGAPRIIIDQRDESLMAAELHPTLENTWFLRLSGRVSDESLSNGAPGSGLDLSTIRVTVYSETGEAVGAGTQAPALTPTATGYIWTLDYLIPETEPTGKLTVTVEAGDQVSNPGKQSVNVYLDATPSVAKLNTGNLAQPAANALLAAEAQKPILTGGALSGTASDIPGDEAPYIGADGKQAASGVQKIQVSLTPSHEVSFLYNEPYPQGLLAWLPLDGEKVPTGADGNPDPNLPTRHFLDISPFQVAGTCTQPDCPQSGIQGHQMGSIYFAGQQQVINMGRQVDLAEKSFSVSLWAKRDKAGHSDPMLWQGPVSMANQRFLFGMNSDNQFVCGFGGSDLLTNSTYPDTGWHAWTCTYDKATGHRAIYRDGELVANDTAAPVPGMNESLYIGLAPVGAFHGYLDNLIVLDHALDAAQVREQYTGYQAVFHMAVEEKFYRGGDRLSDRSGFFHNTTLLTGEDANNKVVAGRVGDYALSFDGSDKLTVDPAFSLQLDRGSFTQTAWVFPRAGMGDQDIISQRDENPEHRYPSLILTGQYGVQAGFGSGYNWFSLETPAGIITPEAWNFVAAVFDGQTYSIYVNGELKYQTSELTGQKPYPASTFDIGAQFNGAIDDVNIYTRPLSGLELAALAAGGWREANMTGTGDQTGWTIDVASGLEGPYQVDARAWDEQGHFSADRTVENQWGGSIDTLAPRLTVKREPAGVDAPGLFKIQFTLEDTMLDEQTIRQNLCPEVTVTREYFNSAWLLATGAPPNTQLYRLTGTCQVSTQTSTETGIYACDLAGNCVTQTYPDSPNHTLYLPMVVQDSQQWLSTPPEDPGITPGTVEGLPLLVETLAQADAGQAPWVEIRTETLGPQDFRSLLHANLQGYVNDDSEVAWVKVKIRRSGKEIYTTNAAVMGDIWNAMWVFVPGQPIANGVYEIEVTAADLAGHQTTVSREITVQLAETDQGR